MFATHNKDIMKFVARIYVILMTLTQFFYYLKNEKIY